MVININRQRFNKKVAQNMGRILGSKIFGYKNVQVEVIWNSSTHVYIEFFETSMSEYARPICRINIFEEKYILTGSIAKPSVTIPVKNFIFDRWRIHRWIDKIIKEYRR